MILTLVGCLVVAGLAVLAAWVIRRWCKRCWPRISLGISAVILVLNLPMIGLAGYLAWRLLAGQPDVKELPIRQGVTYRRDVLTTPNRDLTAIRIIIPPCR